MLYRHDICAVSSFFFSNDTATTEIYTLSLHDALPIWDPRAHRQRRLWVEIDQQYPLAESLEANAKIEGRGRLPDPALLIHDRADDRPGLGSRDSGRRPQQIAHRAFGDTILIRETSALQPPRLQVAQDR